MDHLKWMLELQDKMTGPAERMRKSMLDLNSAMGGATRGAHQFAASHQAIQRALAQSGSSTTSWSKQMRGLGADLGGWIAVADKVAGAIGGVADAMADVAKFGVGKLAYRESTLASFEMMEGGPEAGLAMYDKALEFARKTPFQTKEVVDSFKMLRAAGFEAQAIPEMFAGLGDIAAASGFQEGVIPAIVTQLQQVRSTGKLVWADLKQITGWSGKAGIGAPEVFNAIGKRMGVSAKDAHGLVSDGQVDADTGIAAFFDAIASKNGGLGKVMDRQSTTLTGYFERLKSIPEDIFLTWGQQLDSMPGMTAFKSAMKVILDLFDITTESGKRFQTFVVGELDGVLKSIFAGIADEGGASKVETVLKFIISRVKVLVSVMKGLLEGAKGFIDGLMPTFEKLGAEAFDPENPALFAQSMKDVGHAIGEATGKVVQMIAAVEGLILKWAKLQSDPQMLRFKGLAQMASGNFNQGAMNFGAGLWGGMQESFGSSKTGDAINGKPVDLSRMKGGGSSSEVKVKVQVDGDAQGKDPDELSRRIATELPGALASVFDQMSIEMGEV